MPGHFALDISTSTIKVAEAKTAKNGFELKAFGEIKTPASLQSQNPQDEVVISQAVKKLITSSKIHNKNVYLTLSESEVYSRVIEMPVLNPQELKNALTFEAEQYIPVPLESVYLEYETVFMPPKGVTDVKMEVMIIAAKKTAIDKIVRIIQMAELTPLVIETALVSSVRALKQQLGQNSLLVDIGNSSTDVVIMQYGRIKQTSSIPMAGEALTRAIMNGLNLPYQQAKEYKHIYGLEENQLEGKIAKVIKEPVDKIVTHIEKNLRYANNSLSNSQVDKIILSGGTALLPNLSYYLVERLNKEVILANPLQACLNNNLPQQLMAAAPRFAAVIGLAIHD